MRKSIHSAEYLAFLALLREVRLAHGVTQTELANRLDQSQAFVSKSERGDRRIDAIELWRICQALDEPFAAFISRLDRELQTLALPKR
jgi:transcriptional regulator with XRE-family HTH domain